MDTIDALEKGPPLEDVTLSWSNLSYSVKRKGVETVLLDNVSGHVQGGQLLAILGPSGAGKTTLLDVLAGRKRASNFATAGRGDGNGNGGADGDADGEGNGDGAPVGSIDIEGVESSADTVAKISSYVEQDDALLGVLTVRETVLFAAKLSLVSSGTPRSEIERLADETLASLGLQGVAANRIGTPIQRGISGGQKRRVTLATSLVARPRVLFLDEPVSGLDSATAFEVLSAVQRAARIRRVAVVATIHSPTWETFALFDHVLCLTGGKTAFYGKPTEVVPHFATLGFPCPPHTNPADHMLALVNSDFGVAGSEQGAAGAADVGALRTGDGAAFAEAWRQRQGDPITVVRSPSTQGKTLAPDALPFPSLPAPKGSALKRNVTATLLLAHRNMLNYSRNVLAYGIRFAMYIGMGVLLATVWVNLPQLDSRINDRLSVHFFSVAFLGFMSVAGIPAFLEERAVYLRERKNNLYGPGPYTLAQTVCVLPFLFACVLAFAVIAYWSIGLHGGAAPFFRWLAFAYLGVLAAEMQSPLIAAIVSVFVASLALAAFLNGFWMAVQGYFMRNLPAFWQSWAHWIDYETFSFQLLVKSDFAGLVFPCDGSIADQSCHCSFPSSLVAAGQCAVSGNDVIADLGYAGSSTVLYAFIIVVIIVFYRVAFYTVLRFT